MEKYKGKWGLSKLVCGLCGSIFESKKDPRRKTTNRFCSVKCKVEFSKKNKIKKKCCICNKCFYVQKKIIKRGKRNAIFCGKKCKGVYMKTHQHPKNKIAKGRTGKLSPAYKHGLTSKIKLERSGDDNKKWRESVFKRDDYTCQHCCQRGGELNAHHIKSFSSYPKLRFKVNNGITLCYQCHRKVHKENK